MVHEFRTIILACPLEIYNICIALVPSGSLVTAYGDHPDVMVRRVGPRHDVWMGTRFVFSRTARTVCIVTEGSWTACGYAETSADWSVGQSYVLLWSAMPTVPVRLDMPHADDFTIQSMAFSASADRLVTLSNKTLGASDPETPVSFLTVWDLVTLRIVSLRRLTGIQGVSFDISGSHVLGLTYRPQEPVMRIPVSLEGLIPGPIDGGKWDHLCFSADRSRVIFGKIGEPLFLAGDSSSWCPVELPESNQLHIFFGETHPTPRHRAHIIVSSDGSVIVAKFFVSGTGKFRLRAWSMAHPESPKTFEVFGVGMGHHDILPPALSQDGRLLAYSGASPRLHVYGGPSRSMDKRLFVLGELKWEDQPQFVALRSWDCDSAMLVQLSHDGSLMAGVDDRQVLRVWDVRTGFQVAEAVKRFQHRHSLPVEYFDSKRHAESRLRPIFTNAGVIGIWNVRQSMHAGAHFESHAVILPVYGDARRSNMSHRFSQLCNWMLRDDPDHEIFHGLMSDKDMRSLFLNLPSSVDDALLRRGVKRGLVDAVFKPNQNQHVLGQHLTWRGPMLYLNTPLSGPIILDLSKHPALQDPTITEETLEADLDHSGYDHEMTDDYYGSDSQSNSYDE